MAGQFLTHTERERYEYVPSSISPEDLNRYFYLSDSDIALIKEQDRSLSAGLRCTFYLKVLYAYAITEY